MQYHLHVRLTIQRFWPQIQELVFNNYYTHTKDTLTHATSRICCHFRLSMRSYHDIVNCYTHILISTFLLYKLYFCIIYTCINHKRMLYWKSNAVLVIFAFFLRIFYFFPTLKIVLIGTPWACLWYFYC